MKRLTSIESPLPFDENKQKNQLSISKRNDKYSFGCLRSALWLFHFSYDYICCERDVDFNHSILNFTSIEENERLTEPYEPPTLIEHESNSNRKIESPFSSDKKWIGNVERVERWTEVKKNKRTRAHIANFLNCSREKIKLTKVTTRNGKNLSQLQITSSLFTFIPFH